MAAEHFLLRSSHLRGFDKSKSFIRIRIVHQNYKDEKNASGNTQSTVND